MKSPNRKHRNNSQESDKFKTPRKNVLQKGFNNIIFSRAGSHIIQSYKILKIIMKMEKKVCQKKMKTS